MSPGERLSVLSQDHLTFDEFTAQNAVLKGHATLWNIFHAKDALYGKPDFQAPESSLMLACLRCLQLPDITSA